MEKRVSTGLVLGLLAIVILSPGGQAKKPDKLLGIETFMEMEPDGRWIAYTGFDDKDYTSHAEDAQKRHLDRPHARGIPRLAAAVTPSTPAALPHGLVREVPGQA
jgi:hypothetical protein